MHNYHENLLRSSTEGTTQSMVNINQNTNSAQSKQPKFHNRPQSFVITDIKYIPQVETRSNEMSSVQFETQNACDSNVKNASSIKSESFEKGDSSFNSFDKYSGNSKINKNEENLSEESLNSENEF